MLPLNSGDALADRRYRQIELPLTTAGNKYVRALGRKEPRRRQTDAGSAASNHCNPTLQFAHDWFRPDE
jgi:hypothetical protein